MKFFKIVAFLAPLAFFSCASSTDMPRREIDRPYTLPEDNRSWDLGAGVAFRKVPNRNPSTYSEFIASGGNLSVALSENWTLEWSPFPVSARYQFVNSETDRLGLRFGSGFSWINNDSQGFTFYPFAQLNYLRRISSNFGLESNFSYARSFSTGSDPLDGYNAAFSVGPLFQLDQTKALSLAVGLIQSSRIERMIFITSNTVSSNRIDLGTSRSIPLAANFDWSISPDWIMDFKVGTDLYTNNTEYRSTSALLQFKYIFYGPGKSQ